MALEVMKRNESSFPLILVYVPLVKGTSYEEEKLSILERVMDVVSLNELLPIVNVVN